MITTLLLFASIYLIAYGVMALVGLVALYCAVKVIKALWES